MSWSFNESSVDRRFLEVLACVLGGLLGSIEARADESPAGAPSAQPGAPSAQPGDADARYTRHMDLGIRLFEDRNYDAALTEFELAYEAKRVASPLINTALCHKGRFEYPLAVEVLERVLAEHRDTIDAPEKIERALTELRELLATVEVSIEPAGVAASVSLDGVPVAAGRLGALRVSPGSHELVVRAEGYAEARLPFRVASGTVRALPITLTSTSGRLRVTSAEPGVRVLVDGVERGVGDLELVLPAGNHLVVLKTEGGDLYTLDASIVAGGQATAVLAKDGFVQVGDAPPRGPDEVVRPPVRGLYLSGGLVGGVVAADDVQGFVGFDATVGYQVTNGLGLGLIVRQSFAVPDGLVEALTQVGPTFRIVTDTDRARFLTAIHVGFAYAVLDRDFGSIDVPAEGAANFWLAIEPGLELEVDQVLFGFTTPFQANIGPGGTVQAGLRLNVGYGFW